MKKKQRCIYYDTDLQVEVYEFKGIGQKFISHFHKNYVIGVVEAGSRDFVCNGKSYVINAGDILLINPGQAHGCEQIGSENLHYFSFNISTEVMQKVMFELGGKYTLPHFRKSVVKSPQISSSLLDLKEIIIGGCNDFAKEELFLLIMEQLAEIDCAERIKRDRSRNEEKINKICTYLKRNFYRSITLDELSAVSSVSKYHLIRSFTKVKGISPHKYLETVRIEKSKQLLEWGCPLAQVALKVGFTDQSHFTNLFKSLIGVTPKVYQNIMKENEK